MRVTSNKREVKMYVMRGVNYCCIDIAVYEEGTKPQNTGKNSRRKNLCLYIFNLSVIDTRSPC